MHRSTDEAREFFITHKELTLNFWSYFVGKPPEEQAADRKLLDFTFSHMTLEKEGAEIFNATLPAIYPECHHLSKLMAEPCDLTTIISYLEQKSNICYYHFIVHASHNVLINVVNRNPKKFADLLISSPLLCNILLVKLSQEEQKELWKPTSRGFTPFMRCFTTKDPNINIITTIILKMQDRGMNVLSQKTSERFTPLNLILRNNLNVNKIEQIVDIILKHSVDLDIFGKYLSNWLANSESSEKRKKIINFFMMILDTENLSKNDLDIVNRIINDDKFDRLLELINKIPKTERTKEYVILFSLIQQHSNEDINDLSSLHRAMVAYTLRTKGNFKNIENLRLTDQKKFDIIKSLASEIPKEVASQLHSLTLSIEHKYEIASYLANSHLAIMLKNLDSFGYMSCYISEEEKKSYSDLLQTLLLSAVKQYKITHSLSAVSLPDWLSQLDIQKPFEEQKSQLKWRVALLTPSVFIKENYEMIHREQIDLDLLKEIRDLSLLTLQLPAIDYYLDLFQDVNRYSEWKNFAQQMPSHLQITTLFLSSLNIGEKQKKRIFAILFEGKIFFRKNQKIIKLLNEFFAALAKTNLLDSQTKEKLLQYVIPTIVKNPSENAKIHEAALSRSREQLAKDLKILINIFSLQIETFLTTSLEKAQGQPQLSSLLREACHHLQFNVNPDNWELFEKLFIYSERHPSAIITYAVKLKGLQQEPHKDMLLALFNEYVAAILDNKFPEIRYEITKSEHLRHLFTDNHALLKSWRSPYALEEATIAKIMGTYLSTERKKEEVSVETTDHWEDLLLIGTEVDTCQSIYDTTYNKSLVSYLLDGKIQPIVIKNKLGKIVARAITRLLIDSVTEQPVLYLETIYSKKASAAFRNLILVAAQERAKQLNILLITHQKYEGEYRVSGSNYPAALVSKPGYIPYEYVDAEDKIMGDKGYILSNNKLL